MWLVVAGGIASFVTRIEDINSSFINSTNSKN